MRSGRSGQRSDVLDGDGPRQTVGSLGLAHFFPFCGVGFGSLSTPPG